MNLNDAYAWVQQALIDYANSLPTAAREATALRANDCLRAFQQAMAPKATAEIVQPAEPPAP